MSATLEKSGLYASLRHVRRRVERHVWPYAPINKLPQLDWLGCCVLLLGFWARTLWELCPTYPGHGTFVFTFGFLHLSCNLATYFMDASGRMGGEDAVEGERGLFIEAEMAEESILYLLTEQANSKAG